MVVVFVVVMVVVAVVVVAAKAVLNSRCFSHLRALYSEDGRFHVSVMVRRGAFIGLLGGS